ATRLRRPRQLPRHPGLLRRGRIVSVQAPRAGLPLALPKSVALPDLHRHAASACRTGRESGRPHHLRLHRAPDRAGRASERLHALNTTHLAELDHQPAQAGNTVVVVEHDRGFIESADHVVELGPGSGERGGEIVFNGPQSEFVKATRSLTARYLTGRETIPVPVIRRTARRHLVLAGARQHNLKNVTLRVPLGTLTVARGVSGSATSTLGHHPLYR